MKEIIFYVLMTFNSGHTEAVWTYGPLMTLSQCEALKAATLAEGVQSSWTINGVQTPHIIKCVPVGK